MAERIKRLYFHCSGSSFGSENVVNGWHKARRFMTSWNGIQICTGYNYVVGNGFPFDMKHGYTFLDGEIETARPDWIQTAAVRGDNVDTVHVCLIGKAGEFTTEQTKSAFKICRHYVKGGLAVKNILGHYEWWIKRGEQPRKTCPGINMDKFRNDLEAFLEKGRVATQIPIRIRTRSDVIGRALGVWDLVLGGRRV